MSNIELAIDFGSANTTIYKKGVGIVLKEPTIAIVEKGKNQQLKYIGIKAKKLIGKLPENMVAVRPIANGVVVFPEVASDIIKEFVSRIVPEGLFRKQIKVLATVDSGLDDKERSQFERVFASAGLTDVVLIDAPLSISRRIPTNTGLCVNMGAGTTQVSIVGSEGIISGCSVNIAGDEIDSTICNFLESNRHIKTGLYTAERVKMSILSLFDNDISEIEISAINTITSLATKTTITAKDLYPVITPLIDDICDVIATTVNMAPLDMMDSIQENGIYLSGGTAQLVGLKEYISNKTGLKVTLMQDPTNVIINGTSCLLSDNKLLSELMHFDDK